MFNLYNILILLFVGVWFILILNSRINTIVKLIFLVTFINMFFSHIYFAEHFFDLRGSGYGTRLYWLADLLILIFVFRLLCQKEYRKYFLGMNVFLLLFAIVLISTLLHFQSLIHILQVQHYTHPLIHHNTLNHL